MQETKSIKLTNLMSLDRLFTIRKISDDKFNGEHPNDINEGYVKKGVFVSDLSIGYRFFLDAFSTSMVTEILEEGENKIKFKTLNSTYEVSWENKNK